jgi:hypothetical protein
VASDLAFQAEKVIDAGVKETKTLINKEVDTRTVQRFHGSFPALIAEKLQWHANGKMVSAGASIDGELFISQHFVAFHGFFLDSKTLPGQTLRRTVDMAISIASIVSIQPAIATFGKDLTAAPAIAPLGPGQIATALMLFSMDRSLHLFYQFTHLNDIINVLDHQWRALVNPNAINLNPQPMMQQQPMMSMQPQPMMPMPMMPMQQAPTYQPMQGQPIPMMSGGYPGQVAHQQHQVGQPLPPAYASVATPAPSAPPSDDLYPQI